MSALFGPNPRRRPVLALLRCPLQPGDGGSDAHRLDRAGYPGRPVDQAHGFLNVREYRNHILKEDKTPSRWDRLGTDRPTAFQFWYRESPAAMVPANTESRIDPFDPPLRLSGMATLLLDTRGRLEYFPVIPPQRVEPGQGEGSPDPDWSVLFGAAGLDAGGFREARPEWQPEAYCDRRAAWTGTYPDQPEPEIRVEACAFRGKPVYFGIVHPWQPAWRMQEGEPTGGEKARAVLFGILFLTILAGGLFLVFLRFVLRRQWLAVGIAVPSGALLPLLAIAGLSVYSFQISRAGRPPFAAERLQEETA